MREKEISEIIEDLEYIISDVEDINGTPVIEVKKKVKDIKKNLLETIEDLKQDHIKK